MEGHEGKSRREKKREKGRIGYGGRENGELNTGGEEGEGNE